MKTIALRELPAEWQALTQAALAARERAYAPYSHFAVGAAVRTISGQVYTGCNVENASYGLTVCAERTAVWNAVTAGERDLTGLAVASQTGAMPCGACRQVMAEFAADMPVVVVDGSGNAWLTTVAELLPSSFSQEQLAP